MDIDTKNEWFSAAAIVAVYNDEPSIMAATPARPATRRLLFSALAPLPIKLPWCTEAVVGTTAPVPCAPTRPLPTWAVVAVVTARVVPFVDGVGMLDFDDAWSVDVAVPWWIVFVRVMVEVEVDVLVDVEV